LVKGAGLLVSKEQPGAYDYFGLVEIACGAISQKRL
jgi:hypothetical protein